MSELQIRRIGFRNVGGFLLLGESSTVLIDTGYESTTHYFVRAMENSGRTPDDLDLIILTHVHFDHVGGARRISELSGAPVAVHRSEASLLATGSAPFPKGTRWKGKLIRFAGTVFVRRLARFPAVEADIFIDEELDLTSYGINGTVRHTPGHTTGSLSVILATGEAMVGDNAFGISDKKHFPPFANDKKGVLESWNKYIEWGVSKIYPAHGRSFPADVIRRELIGARQKY